MISFITDVNLTYPNEIDFFSPDEHYPEYAFDHIPTQPNPVCPVVRECLAQAGLDHKRFGTKDWNPFGVYIKPGNRVFVLCNFVYHRRPNEPKLDFYRKCTHASILAAAIDYCLQGLGPKGSVVFGNAALQSCNWESVLTDTGAARIVEYSKKHRLPVSAKDLRLFVGERGIVGNIERIEKRGDHEGVEVDLGEASLLEELPRPRGDQ